MTDATAIDTIRDRDRSNSAASAYQSQILRVRELDETRIAEMAALYLDNYAGSNEALFRADLMEKDHALLVFSSGLLVGFTTIKYFGVEWQKRPTGIIFSGDTIVDPRHWGQRELAFAWLEHVGGIKAAAPESPLYWFLLVKGHRTYRYLSVFARRFYPCWQDSDGESLKPLADFLANARYGDDYNPQTGVVEFVESRGHLRLAIARPERDELERQDVRFFLTRNPGYLQGNELVCVCELAVGNLKPMAARFFQRAPAIRR
ncbi:MAG TPA: hypothetical protein PKN13_04535 [Accumulibacter sp.]|nr:hypothetical protein [Accumulibacter sp.]HMW16585.1 hypothetical protein [Accumulibacter sp.]HNC17485.1 hypothetical protein [Accumulibacter sp.]HND79170.1 hypothetical protein [Accumulibacter sp.]HNE13741.1 hypothetical protein [Accumulibacter sp.]